MLFKRCVHMKIIFSGIFDSAIKGYPYSIIIVVFMKVPLSWLKEYVDLSISIEEISEALTLAGLEVEGIEVLGGKFQGVVAAKVLETSSHPNADRLRIAKVFDGTDTFQVVCGAPNCRPGIIVAFAKVGASLTDETEKLWKIKKSKIRDVESFGMLCSMKELSLSEEQDAIIEWPSDLPLGTDISSLVSDVIFDVALTPNLGHCLSIYGIARELAAILQLPCKAPQLTKLEPSIENPFSVTLEDRENCLRYCLRLVNNVSVQPSPSWLVKKLEKCGLRSINNLVDISNLVMLELGQPLHFFDREQIEGRTLSITSQHPYNQITTLDGEQRSLPTKTLLICDTKGPLALAGIMGGMRGSITPHTKNVLIEAALFLPSKVRSTCKALDLRSDSSYRFERGVDWEMIPVAMDRAVQLLSELAQGESSSKKVEACSHSFTPRKIVCRTARVCKMLGLELSQREIADLLKRLHMDVLKEEEGSLTVETPSFRNDIHEEIDLIEEIARLYGFNRIPKRPAMHASSSLQDAPIFSMENEVRQRLLQEGLQEFITCDLLSPELDALFQEKQIRSIHVLQSKSSDFSILRTSLLPGLLQLVKHNYDHQNHDVHGFEIGRIHFEQEGSYKEQTSIGVVLAGNRSPYHFAEKPESVDFYDLKGIIENLLDRFQIQDYEFEISHLPHFQPGRQARIKVGGACLGTLGEIHPASLAKLDLSTRVYFAEINLHDVLALAHLPIKVKELPSFPGSERDWTVTLKREISSSCVLSAIRSNASSYLEKVSLLGLYQSEKLGLDRKNITFRFFYRDRNKTISTEIVEHEHTKLIQKVAEKLHDCIL